MTNTSGPGYLSVWPKGISQPLVSTLNFFAGQTTANAAVVPLGTGGAISVAVGGAALDLVFDVNGYYAPGTGFVPISGGTMTGELLIAPVAGTPALSVSGNRSSSSPYLAPVALVTNNATNSLAAPALRVVNSSSSSTSPDGVLSVSNYGAGLIARFSNSSIWVAEIADTGTFSTAGNLVSSGNVIATGAITAGGALTVGGNATVTGDLAARNMPGAEYYNFQSTNSDSVAPGGTLNVLVPASTVSIPASASQGVLLVAGTFNLDFTAAGFSGSFCALLDLMEGTTVLATTREQFLVSSRGSVGAKVQWATSPAVGAATRTFQVRLTNCMTGTTTAMYLNDRSFSAIYLPVRY